MQAICVFCRKKFSKVQNVLLPGRYIQQQFEYLHTTHQMHLHLFKKEKPFFFNLPCLKIPIARKQLSL